MKIFTAPRLFLLQLALIFSCMCIGAASAQSKPQITAAVDVTVRHTLGNSVPVQLRSATDLGRTPASQPMRDMVMLLGGSDAQTADLAKFLEDVQNPNTASYHHWLTPSEFGARFGAADEDVKTLTAWLTSNGFTVSAVAQGKNWIRFSGNVGQVESAFGTEMHRYSANGVVHYSNATNLSVPAAIAPVVVGMVSLNDFVKAPQHTPLAKLAMGTNGKLQRTAVAPTAVKGQNPESALQPQFTSLSAPESNFLAPGDFARIYNTSPLLSAGNDGTGLSIAIAGRSDISLSDVEAFRTVFHLPFNDPTVIYANGDPGVVAGDDEEAILDVEWSGAVAPKAKINYVIGASTSTTDGVDIASAYIVDNVVAPIMSISFGSCEQEMSSTELAYYNTLWQQASAEGITVLVSSGDSGSSSCSIPSVYVSTIYGLGVSGLASTPYNVAVGGTEFSDTNLSQYWNNTENQDQSSVKGYIPEAVWNESCNSSLPVGLGNCYFQPLSGQGDAAGGGASNCAVHSSTTNLLTGLYTCTSGYKKPTWQAGNGVPVDGSRDLPDVALAAGGGHDGYLLCYDGSCQWTTNPDGSYQLTSASIIGGTSAASPSMAGIMALVEQKNGSFQGQADNQLYALAASQSSSLNCDSSAATDPTQTNGCVFHDVTAGTNAVGCVLSYGRNCSAVAGVTTYGVSSGYTAGAGYDRASGLGSVNAANLVAAWATATTAPTTTTLTLSQTTFTHGTPVTLGATVAPGTGTGVPTGSVAILGSGTGSANGLLQSGALTTGAYSGSISNLPGGSYNLTAKYSGDTAYNSSTSSPVAVTIAPEPSSVSVSTLAQSPFAILGKRPIVSSTGVALGTTFYIQVVITGASGVGAGTGTVSLSDGKKTFGTFTPDRTGTVYLTCGPGTVCDYPLGTYTFVATYSGDNSFSPSVKTFAPFTISKGTIYWTVNVSTQTPPPGAQVIAKASFQGDPAVIPTGLVTFNRQDTGAVLGTASIDSTGVATIAFNAPAGTYYVTASYGGDANYTAGGNNSYPEIITKTTGTAASVTTMTGTAGNVTLGQAVPLAITVTAATAGSPVPTGTITLTDASGRTTTPVNLVNGAINTFFALTSAGSDGVFATYSGDKNYQGSSSAIFTFTASKATPTMSLNANTPYVAIGAQASVTGVVVPTLPSTAVAAPTGVIQFFDSVAGAAAQPIGTPQYLNAGNGNLLIATLAPLLAQGTHTITAKYSGDANWNAVVSPAVTVIATTPDFSAVVTPNPLTVTAGQTTTLSVTAQSILGFSGALNASCGTLPEGITCTSTTLQPGGSSSITLASTAPGTVLAETKLPQRGFGQLPGAVAFAALALFMLPRRVRRRLPILLTVLLVASAYLVGCGTSSPQSTSIVLTSSNSKSASGSTLTLYATIQSSRTLTGTVSFLDGSTTIASSAPIKNGIAVLNINSLSVGTHPLTAVFTGDSGNLPSQSSDVLQQTITGTFPLTVNVTSAALTHQVTVPVTIQ
jgi:hypothetical protein